MLLHLQGAKTAGRCDPGNLAVRGVWDSNPRAQAAVATAGVRASPPAIPAVGRRVIYCVGTTYGPASGVR